MMGDDTGNVAASLRFSFLPSSSDAIRAPGSFFNK